MLSALDEDVCELQCLDQLKIERCAVPIDDKVVFQNWQKLLNEPKSIFDWPSWEPIQIAYDNRDRANPSLRSRVAERSQLLVQLSDEHGVSIEGVRVRVVAWVNRPMEDITVTFEVLNVQNWLCISRIDIQPTGPHTNQHWRKFNLNPDVNGSHIHSFEDNVKLGREAFAPLGNLPNALPLDEEPASFREICQLVTKVFRVEAFDSLPTPEWNGSLL